MIRRTRNENAESRMIRLDALMAYLSMGRTSAEKFAEDANAVRKIGRAKLYDREAIDRALDAMR